MNVAIITAGGKGKRVSNDFKKQFASIEGKPLLFWTIDKFVASDKISKIIITLPEEEKVEYEQLIIEEYTEEEFKIICGGQKRQDSVFKGLQGCPHNTEYVLIHDGVRPFVKTEEIDKIIDLVVSKKAVIPVCDTKNTIKKVCENKVVNTLNRNKLVYVLTPQAFTYHLLFDLHKKAKDKGLYFTDDASILEHFGYDVFTIKTSTRNFKITDKFDLEIAKYLIKHFRSN